MNRMVSTQTASIAPVSAEADVDGGGPKNARFERTLNRPKSSAERFPSLDGLRGISIWTVMLAHASTHFAGTPLHVRRVHVLLAIMAYFGVTTFFVISGFLITKLLLREHLRTSGVDLGSFYRRRAVRIFPAALSYILIVLLMAKVTAGQAACALTFTTTYFFDYAAKPLQQLWSLSVEEQFYLLWPLAFCFGVRNAKRYCWVIMFLSPFIRILLKHHGYTQYSHLAPAIGDSLAAGCLLAFYENQVAVFAKTYFRSAAAFLTLCLVTLSAGLIDLFAGCGASMGYPTLPAGDGDQRHDRTQGQTAEQWCSGMDRSPQLLVVFMAAAVPGFRWATQLFFGTHVDDVPDGLSLLPLYRAAGTQPLRPKAEWNSCSRPCGCSSLNSSAPAYQHRVSCGEDRRAIQSFLTLGTAGDKEVDAQHG